MRQIKGVIISELCKGHGVWWYSRLKICGRKFLTLMHENCFCVRKNNSEYSLKNRKGDISRYVSFNDDRIMTHYHITIKYVIGDNHDYPDQNTIQTVKYHDMITSIPEIINSLKNIVGISNEAIIHLVKKFGATSVETIIKNFDQIPGLVLDKDDWLKFDRNILESLINSMPNRIQQVIKNNGDVIMY